METTLISSIAARNRTRLIFIHTEGAQVFGPFVEYRPSGENVTTFLDTHRSGFLLMLVERELILNSDNALSDDAANPTFVWCTVTQFRARVRELFRAARGRDLCRLAWYINQFGLTNTQLGNLFGVSGGAITTLKTRLDSLAAKYLAFRDEAGQ